MSACIHGAGTAVCDNCNNGKPELCRYMNTVGALKHIDELQAQLAEDDLRDYLSDLGLINYDDTNEEVAEVLKPVCCGEFGILKAEHNKLKKQLEAVRGLLKIAECPDGNCIDGKCGVWKGELPDGNEVWEYYECQWCAERKAAIGEVK